jgi:hypothetical protein
MAAPQGQSISMEEVNAVLQGLEGQRNEALNALARVGAQLKLAVLRNTELEKRIAELVAKPAVAAEA